VIPPRRRLHALRLLGQALVAPAGAPPPTDPSWRDVKTLAREHGLLGALRDALPGDEDVAGAHRQTMGRNLVARRQLHDLVATMQEAGIDVLVFKGAQYLFDGTVSDLGTRTMADLDIAVPAADLTSARHVLEELGYRAAPVRPFEYPHELPYIGPAGTVVPVELHVELGSPPIPDVVAVDDARARAVAVDIAGTTARGLTLEDALVHHVLHAQVQDLNHAVAGVALRQLHTFALLASRDDVPWDAVSARLEAAGFDPAWRAYAALAEWVFGVEVHQSGGASTRSRIDRTLALASFAIGEWPSNIVRNVRFALGADYLDATYELGGDRRRLPAARVRHLWRTARSSGREAVGAAVRPRR
jgi:hypothetical protein